MFIDCSTLSGVMVVEDISWHLLEMFFQSWFLRHLQFNILCTTRKIWDSVFCFREIHGLKNTVTVRSFQNPEAWRCCDVTPDLRLKISLDPIGCRCHRNGEMDPFLPVWQFCESPTKDDKSENPSQHLPFLLNFCFFFWFFWFQMNWNSGDGLFCDI